MPLFHYLMHEDCLILHVYPIGVFHSLELAQSNLRRRSPILFLTFWSSLSDPSNVIGNKWRDQPSIISVWWCLRYLLFGDLNLYQVDRFFYVITDSHLSIFQVLRLNIQLKSSFPGLTISNFSHHRVAHLLLYWRCSWLHLNCSWVPLID